MTSSDNTESAAAKRRPFVLEVEAEPVKEPFSRAKVSNPLIGDYWFYSDEPPMIGGKNSAPPPTTYLAAGYAF